MREEIVDGFRKIGLIDRLNRIVGELAASGGMMRQNRQRKKIEQKTEHQSGKNPERTPETGEHIPAERVRTEAPDRQKHPE